jgi:hypothetical protein
MTEKLKHLILGFALVVGVSTVAYAVTPAVSDAVPCGTQRIYRNASGEVIGMRTWQPLEVCDCFYVEWGITSGSYEVGQSAC